MLLPVRPSRALVLALLVGGLVLVGVVARPWVRALVGGGAVDGGGRFARGYSAVRSAEADEFVGAHGGRVFRRTGGGAPEVCVGMLTVARPGGSVYARTTVGSLLAGLGRGERDAVKLVVLVGHADPRAHPVFAEPWLANVADRVLTYDSADPGFSADERARLVQLDRDRARSGTPDREKHLADYTHLLRVCAATGAPYVLMIEDDVLFLLGWFHRAKAALAEVEARAGPGNWFYLRLFFNDGAFGWDRELTDSLLLAVAGAGLVFAVWRLVLPRTRWGSYVAVQRLSAVAVPVLALALAAAVCGVLVRAHRASPAGWRGVRPMPANGCCAQAIVFPADKVEPLAGWYEQQRIGFVDTLAEQLAAEQPHGYGRWAVNPVLAQHVGSNSSKGDNWGSDKPGRLSSAARIWNAAFEKNDAQQLAAEHDRVVGAPPAA